MVLASPIDNESLRFVYVYKVVLAKALVSLLTKQLSYSPYF
jgi:hypothetical protein